MEDTNQQKQVNWEALYIQATQDLTQCQHALRLMQMELNEAKGVTQGEQNANELPGETIIENGKDKSKPN